MQSSTQKNYSFNPIQYLGISGLDKNEEEILAKRLEEVISEYLVIKLLQELPTSVDDDLKNGKVQTIEDLRHMLELYFPDLDEKISEYLIEFKQKYNNDK